MADFLQPLPQMLSSRAASAGAQEAPPAPEDLLLSPATGPLPRPAYRQGKRRGSPPGRLPVSSGLCVSRTSACLVEGSARQSLVSLLTPHPGSRHTLSSTPRSLPPPLLPVPSELVRLSPGAGVWAVPAFTPGGPHRGRAPCRVAGPGVSAWFWEEGLFENSEERRPWVSCTVPELRALGGHLSLPHTYLNFVL